MAIESINIKRNRKPEDDSWSSEGAAPNEKKGCEIDQSITVLTEDEMPDLIEDDYRITVAKYEALNNDTKQRVNNAIQYDESLGKTFTYWKKGLDVIRKNSMKNADIKDTDCGGTTKTYYKQKESLDSLWS
jgi:hypothetical protein